jgi:hypothetical protein
MRADKEGGRKILGKLRDMVLPASFGMTLSEYERNGSRGRIFVVGGLLPAGADT